MNKFIISESEKNKILDMHKTAIKRQYLSEQGQVVDKTIIDKIIEKWITYDLGPNGEGLSPHICKPGIKNSVSCLNFIKGEEPEVLDSFFGKNGFTKYNDTWTDENYIEANNHYNELEKNKSWKY